MRSWPCRVVRLICLLLSINVGIPTCFIILLNVLPFDAPLLGLFSYSLIGTFGAFIMMFGHALTSAALFFGVGVLYDRYKTRLIFYYGALVSFMPIFSVLYFIFILANFGFPGTFNFVGEFLILLGGLNLSSTFIVFSTIYYLFSSVFISLVNQISSWKTV